MNLRISSTPSSQLIDSVMDGYVSWREASAAVELTYRRWTRACGGEERGAFEEYVAALDREQDAAEKFRLLIERASPGATR